MSAPHPGDRVRIGDAELRVSWVRSGRVSAYCAATREWWLMPLADWERAIRDGRPPGRAT